MIFLSGFATIAIGLIPACLGFSDTGALFGLVGGGLIVTSIAIKISRFLP